MKPETAALLGQQVGHIRVVDVLGEGGMGAVYVGFDDKLQRKVALKAISSEYRLHEEAKARFLREARILSQLDHPHICTVHDFIEGDDCDILVLELVQGKSLRAALKDELGYPQKLSIARQLLEVLVAVHGQGVINRDLKPENVMITTDGGIKVLDFGLARSADEEGATPSTAVTLAPHEGPADSHLDVTIAPSRGSRSVYVKTRLGTVIGTVGYMSPEQARGEPATAASDMYSLGLILQEMFTGKAALQEDPDAGALILKAAKAETAPASGLSPDLTALIERLKAVAPGARPSSVDALAELERITDRPRRRRRRAVRSAVVLGLVFGMFGTSIGFIRATQQAQRAEREARAAQEVSDFLMGLFQVSDPSEARGNSITAREILDRGAERIERELAGEPLVQARLMETMGNVYRELGLYEPATPLLEKALELHRSEWVDEHPDVATSLHNLAVLQYAKGDYDGAEPLLREALAMRRRLLGEEHTLVAGSLNDLGMVLWHKGDHDDAEPLYREGLAILEKVLPPDHPDLRKTVERYASLLREMGRDAEAEELEARVKGGGEHEGDSN
jgi:serine/threonine-protein kinase